MAYQYAQLDPFALYGAGAVAGATTITFKSFQTIDGVNLTMTDFGSIGYGTIDPGNGSLEEQISFTGVTQNTNGTATLTGVKSVLFLSPYTATTGLSKTHAGSTPFVISNTSGFYNELTAKQNNEVLTGYWDAPDPLAAAGIATKGYVDNLVNGGTVTTNALIEVGIAGETITIGTPVYLKAADGRWWKASGATAATVNTIQLGIAQGAGTAGINIVGGVLRRGVDTHQSGGAAGSIGYVSDTSTISTSTGTVERAIGNFLSATTFDFDPSFYYTPTASQKAAFAGSVGTPSGTNTFLTQAGMSDGSTDQSQATQNGTQPCGQANSTTKANKVAQSFIPTDTIIKSVNLYKAANTGTFTGTVTISIQADSAGSPSGSSLASKTITNVGYLAYSTGDFLALLSSELTVTPGNLYWIVISTSTSDNSNCINLGTNTAGGYASGSVKYDNTADGWVAIATIDLYFKVNQGFNGKAIKASSTGFVPTTSSLLISAAGVCTSVSSAVTIIHGLGKLPGVIRASCQSSSSSDIAISNGVYVVASAAYAFISSYYNEATSGSTVTGTNKLCSGGVNNNETLTVTYVDENIVTFTGSGGITFQYEINA